MVPKRISHYEILDKLGEGGMGVVYRARDTRLDRIVALKFLPRHLSESSIARERFVQEAKAASALDHRNICTVHDIDTTDEGELFIAMAYYSGQTLRKKLDRGPLATAELLDVATQMAEGLARAHEAGIVHRDVKPGNVILTERGEVKLLDFGLAKMPDKNLTEAGTLMGTATYMSPEQVRGENVDHRTDIWSLGVVLYEMLKGEPPFLGEPSLGLLRAIEEQARPPLGEAPSELVAIIDRTLEKDRASRYASMNDFVEDLRSARITLGFSDPSSTPALPPVPVLRRPRYIALVVVAISALVTLGYFGYRREARARWARQVALPEIERLADAMSWAREGTYAWSAVELAREAEPALPGDPVLERLWSKIAREVDIDSTPSGASLFAKPYSAHDDEWIRLGQTPFRSRLPVGFARLKLEKEGHRTLEDIVWIYHTSWRSAEWRFDLPEKGILPEEMVPFPAETPEILLPGVDHLDPEPLATFLMDRFELTNEEFKRFLEAGGYEKKEFWREPFVREGRAVSWEEAMRSFKDKTGRTGPSTWEVGDYPKGQGNYPVSGVSWYEAAAYAAFAGKDLPTLFHWNQAAFNWSAAEVVPLSNLNGKGPAGVGSYPAMTRRGTYDLAGNVREWSWNSTGDEGFRFILGGGWNDPAYVFTDIYAQTPWDRSPTNGFRCIRYSDAEKNRARLTRNLETPFRDYSQEKPVSPELFQLYLSQFAYDPSDLSAVVETEQENEHWRTQKVSFDAAYGGERMFGYLFLPRKGRPPYQTVLFFPGLYAINDRSSEYLLGEETPVFDVAFLLKSGRAVMFPVYKSTYERGDGLESDYPDETIFYKEHVIMWVKDCSRSIDYLETREDIDSSKLAYLGVSWGGGMGAIVPAVEKRLDASILSVAGMYFKRALPEVDAVNYVSRVTHPVLMLNGEYDFFFPLETSQRPMFELLGTPEKDKRWQVYPGSHYVPPPELIRESLDWLDKYLGPVSQ